MITDAQRAQALEIANAKRSELSQLKRRLKTDQGALEDLMLSPPSVLTTMLLIDVIRLGREGRSTASLHRLGRLAIRDGINLMVPLGEASERTRMWVAIHARWNWGRSYRTLQVVA